MRGALVALALALAPGLVLAQSLAPAPGRADPHPILVGLDGKTFYEAAGSRNGPNGSDAVAVLDARDPARPVVAALLPLANSVYGPPTNLAVTPDGRLGLVASSVVMGPSGENWYAEPDDRLHVLDLAGPPRLVETIRVGRQPSGLAIAPGGDLALVANRAGRSVSVVALTEGSARHLGEVPVGDEAAAVAISPDGRRALVAKNLAARLGVLAIEGRGAAVRVTYDAALDLPVGAGVYGVAFTPDGRFALTANLGAAPSDGHADTVSVVRMDARPRVVDHLGVGDTPETLAMAPDGRHAVVVLVRGSAAAHADPAYTPTGALALLTLDGTVRVADVAEAGAVPEGVAFAPDGVHVYVGNYADRTLGIYRIEGDRLVEAGPRLPLPGQPASMGGPARR